MPKYLGKQIFTHGSFPEVGENQKAEKKKKKKKEKKNRWKKWPASLCPPPRVAHTSMSGPKNKNDLQALYSANTYLGQDHLG